MKLQIIWATAPVQLYNPRVTPLGPHPFINNDYYCESGSPGVNFPPNIFLLMIHCGMAVDALKLILTVAVMLTCLGSTVNFLWPDKMILKQGFVLMQFLIMKLLQLISYISTCTASFMINHNFSNTNVDCYINCMIVTHYISGTEYNICTNRTYEYC